MMKIFKKKQFWGSLIATALLAYCLKDISLAEIEELSHRLNPIWFLPAVLSSFAFVMIKALRWRLMISQQTTLTCVRAITVHSAGQILNILMPVLTGQVGRMFLFANKVGLRKTFVFSTIVLEILFDAISLIVFLLLTSLAYAFPPEYRSFGIGLAAVTITGLVALYIILHFQTQLENLGRKLFRARYPGVHIGIKKFIRTFTKGIELLRSSQHLAGSLLYSLAAWLGHTLVVYFLLMSFGFDLPFHVAATVMIINTIALMVPITPGNAGTFELAVSSSLIAFDVGRSDAVLFAVALHMLDLVPIMVLGSIFLNQDKISLSQLRKEHEDEVILDAVDEDGRFIDQGEKA